MTATGGAGETGGAGGPGDEIVDRLYGLPLAEFTQARNTAASDLRKAGQRDAAAKVKALRRPTVAAGAVNRLVREHRGEVEHFLRAAAELRDVQFSGEGDLAAAGRQEHEALERLTRIGGEAVRQTLLAAAVDDDAARQLLEARLERELEPRGFGTLLAHAPAGKKPQSSPTERVEPDDNAALAELHEAQVALRAAEAEERQASRHLDQTRRDVERARAAVAQAQRDLDRLRNR